LSEQHGRNQCRPTYVTNSSVAVPADSPQNGVRSKFQYARSQSTCGRRKCAFVRESQTVSRVSWIRWRNLRMPAVLRVLVRSDVAPDVNKLGREAREYIWTTGGLCDRAAPSSHSEECAVMDQQRDREQLERKLNLCRRLSGAASDPTTSIRLARRIGELEHSLRETENFPA
jgi:hypothetical protein